MLQALGKKEVGYYYTGPLAVISGRYGGPLHDFKQVFDHYDREIGTLSLADMTSWGSPTPGVAKHFKMFGVTLSFPFLGEVVKSGSKAATQETVPMSSALKKRLFGHWVTTKVIPEQEKHRDWYQANQGEIVDLYGNRNKYQQFRHVKRTYWIKGNTTSLLDLSHRASSLKESREVLMKIKSLI